MLISTRTMIASATADISPSRHPRTDPFPRGGIGSIAITVPVLKTESSRKTVRADLIVAAVFCELQICPSLPPRTCTVLSRLAVHKKRVLRYEFAKLSGGDVSQSRKRRSCGLRSLY